MPEGTSNSIVNLGDLSKPADTLIEKVSSAIGGLFEPWQIERVAKAQAKADLIKAKSEIEITDLHRRAMGRFVEEEARRQNNMEQIIKKALPKLEDGSDPNKMDDDWVTNFFDKARIVSDVEMQELWSKVLAGEANTPGTYSKRTVNFLGELDRQDGELFQNLCGYGWIIEDTFVPLIFDLEANIYNKNGINFSSVSHLESIGLVHCNYSSGFHFREIPQVCKAYYYGQPLILNMEKEKNSRLDVGNVFLTKLGQELVAVCSKSCVEGFIDYIKDQWRPYLSETDNT